MTPITQRDVLAHQAVVPWPSLRQVEQDLLLCRSMAELFNDKFLRGQIAMRGGTLLHKVHLAPAARYSEDIDLVVFGDRPEGHIEAAIRRVLKPLLGEPVDTVWDNLRLAIRNLAQPSKVLRLTYSTRAVSEAGANLDIVVEANVSERKPHRSIVEIPFQFPFQGATVAAVLNGYDLHEMLGTKMRALFQRKRGRDLFDLYWALTSAKVDPALVIESFLHYLHQEGNRARRAEFVAILDSHLGDRGFCNDMNQLLRTDLSYDPQKAGPVVRERLLSLLPE
jgi:predicted nucleotidyltransferase component of viral defense system